MRRLMNNELERKEAVVSSSVFGVIADPISSLSTIMISIYRIIPKFTDEGELAIPPEALTELADSVSARFNAILEAHDHKEAGAYHDRPYVDQPHYLFNLIAESDAELQEVIDAIDPQIEELVNTYTKQMPAVPAGR